MKTKNCENCNFCETTYQRVFYRFFRRQVVYCTKKETLVSCGDGCDDWQKIQPRGYDLSSQRFDAVAEDIAFLCEFFAEY